ncbi:MAG: acyltransferase [Aquabacterium sp.]
MNNQLGFLDGIRGLMALWVLASHIVPRVNGPTDTFLLKGGIAVDVFMLVSGILMTHNFYRREHKEPLSEAQTWKRFYIRRFFRIAPLYYLLLAFVLVFADPLHQLVLDTGGSRAGHVEQNDALLINVLTHVTFTFGLFPSWSSSNVLPDWSLSLEMQFYAMFPLMLLLMRANLIAFFAVTLVAYHVANTAICVYSALPTGCLFYPQPTVLPLKVASFAAGMLIVQLTQIRPQWQKIIIAACFSILVFYLQRLTFTALAIGTAAVYYFNVATLQPSPARTLSTLANRILGSAPFKFFGDISYSVYLCHFLVLLAILPLARDVGWLDIASPWGRFLVACVLITPPTVLLSWLLYKFLGIPSSTTHAG